MNDFKKRIVPMGVGFLVMIVFIFYLSTFVVPKVLVFSSKASASSKVSTKNSFLLGEKIMAKADGKEKCIVNVFAVDANGKGVAGKQVQLSGLGSQTGTTDSLGKATFELTSTVAKQYELMANVNGVALVKTIMVTFR